jgi:lysophospholipase L1-like esterase
MGASTTEAASVKEELRFPALVSDLLAEKGRRINTRNIGYSGNTIHDGLNVLLNHVVLDHPDYVVLMTGGIDAGGLVGDPPYSEKMARPLTARDVRIWLKQRLTSASWLLAWLRYAIAISGANVRPAAVDDTRRWKTFPEEEFRRRVRAFVAMARAFEIEPVLVPDPYAVFGDDTRPRGARVPARDRAADVVREVGAQEGVVVIDLPAHLREAIPGYDEPMRIFYDGVHLTDAGSRVYAAFIAEQLHTRVLPPMSAAATPALQPR